MKRIIYILGCFLGFISCSKEATVKLPEAKPLPVMYSYISPADSFIRLKLFLSSPLYSSSQGNVMDPVPDANVKISGAQGTAQLLFNQDNKYYELKTSSYVISPGQSYTMTATTSNGDVATAETQVPITTVPVNTVTIETVAEQFRTSERIKLTFNDEPGAVNYYRMAVAYAVTNPFLPDTVTHDTRINELYADVNNDGADVLLGGTFYPPFDTVWHYDVYLYNCSPAYYLFHRSLKNYSGENPFAEPTLVYTNVKGGFGCFAAYTRSRYRYKR